MLFLLLAGLYVASYPVFMIFMMQEKVWEYNDLGVFWKIFYFPVGFFAVYTPKAIIYLNNIGENK